MSFITTNLVDAIRSELACRPLLQENAAWFQRYVRVEEIALDVEHLLPHDILANYIGRHTVAEFISCAYPTEQKIRQQSCINAVVRFMREYGEVEPTDPLAREYYWATRAFCALNSLTEMEKTILVRQAELLEIELIKPMLVTYWRYACELQDVLQTYAEDYFSTFIVKLEPFVRPYHEAHWVCRDSQIHLPEVAASATKLIRAGEEILKSLQKKPDLSRLYQESRLERARLQAQTGGMTWMLGPALIKSINRTIRGDISHSLQRRNYLTAIIAVCWAIFNRSAHAGEIMERGSFKIIDTDGSLYNFLLGYVRLATGQETPGFLVANDFAYARKSSHYNAEIESQFGIDIRLQGGDYLVYALPGMNGHLLFGRAEHKFTFLKFEPVGLGCLSEFAMHSNNFLWAQLVSPPHTARREKDVPGVLVQLFSNYCDEFGLAPEGARAIHEMLLKLQQPLPRAINGAPQPPVAKKQRLISQFIQIAARLGFKNLEQRHGSEIIVELDTDATATKPVESSQRLLEDDDLVFVDTDELLPNINNLGPLTLGQLHSLYALLIKEDSVISLTNVTGGVLQQSLAHKLPCYKFFNSNHDDWRLLFIPGVVTANTEAGAPTLSYILHYYKTHIHSKIPYAKRLIIPLAEKVTSSILALRGHIITLVIDYVGGSYNARIIDPKGVSFAAYNEEEKITAVVTTVLGEVTWQPRELLGHQGFLDHVSCGYFTAKIIMAALESPCGEGIIDYIPKSDSWFNSSTNWLSQEDKSYLSKAIFEYFTAEISMYGVEMSLAQAEDFDSDDDFATDLVLLNASSPRKSLLPSFSVVVEQKAARVPVAPTPFTGDGNGLCIGV